MTDRLLSRFRGKRILITGASSGIGKALALQLAGADADLVLIGRNSQALESLQIELCAVNAGRKIEVRSLDISNEQAVNALMAELSQTPVDILINNAGVACNDQFENLSPDDFRHMVDTNFLGQVWMCRALLESMKRAGQGQIVNIASMAGVLGIAGYTAYGASKFALVGFTRSLRNELSGTGVSTTLILPSDVDTPQLHQERQTRSAANRALAESGAAPLSADQAAAKIIQAIAKGKTEAVISPLSGRLLLGLCRLFPAISNRVMDAITRKHNR